MRYESPMTPADLFNPDHYVDVRRPLVEASTLPSWCYTNPSFYQREVEQIFLKHWNFAGRVDQLSNSGDPSISLGNQSFWCAAKITLSAPLPTSVGTALPAYSKAREIAEPLYVPTTLGSTAWMAAF